ncbi:hypothetical protein CEUSTIGMA_g5494.t1 [Chlamydomonas eustigma]|uniref:dual-specificity kinase n=1 Tax=Chlamydomonas eustigma TaxID=1157962 RepID=A0A250X590_9CHLO|nr:hypothetical protein CEUSTIGMA_g5494.t1 [Chlamydomonas eustigma]|eukprot:GAX78052.1 hypothetical protein CEUSTIGMA_g5494.t1 [Chlamydomonas eustigma]
MDNSENHGLGAEALSVSEHKQVEALSPEVALEKYRSVLTPYEFVEIMEYQEVYFVGKEKLSKVQGNDGVTDCNHGYDENDGSYKLVLHDHLDYRYEILSIVAEGTTSQVVHSLDMKNNKPCAIKILRNKKRFHQQGLVEAKLLTVLMEKDPKDKYNIMRAHGYFYFRHHFCIKCEPLALNLNDFILRNSGQGLSQVFVCRIAQQILEALKFLKDQDIIHTDLKPENIMLKATDRSKIKLVDFGSAYLSRETMLSYIQSRFYRAPEVMLGLPYSLPIDMWSFACILAELHTGSPLFPGEDELDQFQCIMELLNIPSAELLTDATRSNIFFEDDLVPRITVNGQGRVRSPGSKTLPVILNCPADHTFVDFLSLCLVWDPEQRLTPEQALEHPWILEHVKSAKDRNEPTNDSSTTERNSANSSSTLFKASQLSFDDNISPQDIVISKSSHCLSPHVLASSIANSFASSPMSDTNTKNGGRNTVMNTSEDPGKMSCTPLNPKHAFKAYSTTIMYSQMAGPPGTHVMGGLPGTKLASSTTLNRNSRAVIKSVPMGALLTVPAAVTRADVLMVPSAITSFSNRVLPNSTSRKAASAAIPEPSRDILAGEGRLPSPSKRNQPLSLSQERLIIRQMSTHGTRSRARITENVTKSSDVWTAVPMMSIQGAAMSSIQLSSDPGPINPSSPGKLSRKPYKSKTVIS